MAPAPVEATRSNVPTNGAIVMHEPPFAVRLPGGNVNVNWPDSAITSSLTASQLTKRGQGKGTEWGGPFCVIWTVAVNKGTGICPLRSTCPAVSCQLPATDVYASAPDASNTSKKTGMLIEGMLVAVP